MPTVWTVAPSLEALARGEGVRMRRSPMDWLISQGYQVVYKEYLEDGRRWLLWDHEGNEIAVERRYVPPGRMGEEGGMPPEEVEAWTSA